VERRAHRPRIADVAREAGVSKTAVSFAFNSPERLSLETADRIREVADSLGYRPHPVARMLTQRRTMTLGVLTPQALSVIFSNPYFALFNEGIARAAEERGYELHFISPILGSLVTAIGRATVDGVVAIGVAAEHPEVGQIRTAGLPLVMVDSEDSDHGSVIIDEEGGACAAAAHLLELGHRDILVLAVEAPQAVADDPTDGLGEPGRHPGGQATPAVTIRRLRGYRQAFESVGLTLDPDWIVAARASIEGGAAAFQQAWGLGLRPTAVLAMSDAMALGAIRAARELGLEVPAELSVVGFDDIDLASQVDPALTTVHQPIRQKGFEAVRLLLEEVEQGAIQPRHLRLETRLVVRGSTAPPHARWEVPGTQQ
jgi:alanine racemase